MRQVGRAILAAVTVVPLMVGCGPDKNDAVQVASEAPAPPTADNQISGNEREFAIRLTSQAATAGTVTFAITNYGSIQHEFLVVRTDLAPGEIPVGTEGKFDEEESGINVVDEISEFDAGATEQLSVDLEPGRYQLVCNIPGHYAQGMYAAFEVLA